MPNNSEEHSNFPYSPLSNLYAMREFYHQLNNPLNNFALRESFSALEKARQTIPNIPTLFTAHNQLSSAVTELKKAASIGTTFQNLNNLQSRLEDLRKNFFTSVTPDFSFVSTNPEIQQATENFFKNKAEPIKVNPIKKSQILTPDSISPNKSPLVDVITELIDIQKETMEIIKDLAKSTNESVTVSKETAKLQREEKESNKITEIFNKKMAKFTLWIGIATLIATVIPLIIGLLKWLILFYLNKI